MGYTHYWTRPEGTLSDDAWGTFLADVKKLLAAPEVAPLVCWESDDPTKPPEISAQRVRFNGRGGDGHETLLIGRKTRKALYANDNVRWDFCKTAQKPYDAAVCCVLLLAAEHLGFTVSSDGEWDTGNEWQPARELFRHVFNRLPQCPENMLRHPNPAERAEGSR